MTHSPGLFKEIDNMNQIQDKNIGIFIRIILMASWLLITVCSAAENNLECDETMKALQSDYPTTISAFGKTNGPVDIFILGKQQNHNLSVETYIVNTADSKYDGVLTWDLIPRGNVMKEPVKFTVRPGETLKRQCGLRSGNREVRLMAEVSLQDDTILRKEIGLMSMPLRMASPLIDGNLDEWFNVPSLKLNRSKFITPQDSSNFWTQADASASVMFWWNDDSLYVGARIMDDDPLYFNPLENEQGYAERLILLLSLDGPCRSRNFDDSDFRIDISASREIGAVICIPLAENRIIKTGRVITRKTREGYILEASVPFKDFTSWKPKRETMIGFDMIMEDYDGEPDRWTGSLCWSGSSDSFNNPVEWGLAVIY